MKNLSEEAKAKLIEWDYKYKEDYDRITWNNFYLGMAFWIARKSHDPQTQCGCVMTDENYAVISTGYNGFMRDIDDSVLPNLRPEKYTWMIHAEHNAILNAARQGKSLEGATAYVTGPPCIYCLQYMYQSGIKRVIHSTMNVHNKHQDELIEQEIIRELVKKKMTIEKVEVDINMVQKNFQIIAGKLR